MDLKRIEQVEGISYACFAPDNSGNAFYLSGQDTAFLELQVSLTQKQAERLQGFLRQLAVVSVETRRHTRNTILYSINGVVSELTLTQRLGRATQVHSIHNDAVLVDEGDIRVPVVGSVRETAIGNVEE